MTALRVVLVLLVALAFVACASAQETATGLTGDKAEVATAIEGLGKALMAGDMEALKQALWLPTVAAMAIDGGPPQVEEITEDLLADEAAAAALARYGLATKVELVRPVVVTLAFNVAVFGGEIRFEDDAGNRVVTDRMAALLVRQGGGWRLAAVIAGGAQAGVADEATAAEITGMLDGALGGLTRDDQEAYLGAYSAPIIDVDAERGARRLTRAELQEEFRQLTFLLMDGGVANVAVDAQLVVTLGDRTACAIGVAKGLDAAGQEVGYRPQALLLVKGADTWKVIAQASGFVVEGVAPQRLPGLPEL